MKLFTCQQIKIIDAYTIKNEPIKSLDLMERAAQQCTNFLIKHITKQQQLIFFCGPGNNGGDGLAIARQLYNLGFKNSTVYFLNTASKFSNDFSANLKQLKRLKKIKIYSISKKSQFPDIPSDYVVIDALFGTGLTRPLEHLAAELVKHINKSNAYIISIDMPSGLFGEDNSNNNFDTIIKANYTLTFQFPKLSFLFPENSIYVGDFRVLSIGLHPKIIDELATPYYFTEVDYIKLLLRKREKFSHKGTYGHALLVAGRYGKTGAALLGAKACLRSGVGLLTVHLPQRCVEVLHSFIPEAMASIDNNSTQISEVCNLQSYDAIAIGPAIGTDAIAANALKKIITTYKKPIVFDADAISILANNKLLLNKIPMNCIFTPHIKEFERLTGKATNSFIRLQKQIDFSKKYKCIVVLKGAHTTVSLPDGKVYFNTTGNPGMATAGSGDVLTGIILSFLAQQYLPHQAAIAGMFIHGLAGDIAANECGQYSLIASDIINYLGKAFIKII